FIQFYKVAKFWGTDAGTPASPFHAGTAGVIRTASPSRFRQIPVTMAEGPHPFPFRTRPLSPPAPMILHTSGKVGCRRVKLQAAPISDDRRGFFCLNWHRALNCIFA